MSDTNLHRRRFLVLAGAATVTGLAGCTTGSQNANNQMGGRGSTPTPSPEAEHSEPEAEHSGSNDDHAEDDGHADEEEGGHTEEESSEHAKEESGGHADDGHGHGEAVGDPVDVADVGMASTSSGEHFEPHVVRVTNGGTVRWTNESGMHSTTAYSPANDKSQLMPDGATSWDSGLLTEEDAVFEHTFETEGVYHYYCAPHESIGMIGSVIVGEPDAHGQPALEEPPEDMPERVRDKITELNEMCNQALGHTH